MITVPDSLAALLLRDNDDARQWIDDFPDLSRDVLQAWNCEPNGAIRAGAVAVVIPVRSPSGLAVVKISYPHLGSTGEAEALGLWNGDGAIRLLDSDTAQLALLLERVDDRSLDVLPDQGIAIGGQLLARLAVPAPARMHRLADTADEWEQQIRNNQQRSGHSLPDRTIDAAIETVRDLGQDTTTTMLHGDLHGGNILNSDRGWVVIDPKGMVGTPAYDAITMCSYRRPHAANAEAEIAETNRRIEIFSDAAGVAVELTRRCVHARAVTALLWDFTRGDVPRTRNFEFRMHVAERLVG